MKLTASQTKTLEAFKANGGVWTHTGNEFRIDRRSAAALEERGHLVRKGSHATGDFRYELV